MTQVENELMHYGVLGMKWGVRKEEAKAYRDKATAVSKNIYAQAGDRRRAKYASDPVAKRVGAVFAKRAAIATFKDVFGPGGLEKYASMSQKDISKHIRRLATQVVTDTAITVAVNETMAKRSMSYYDQTGRSVKGGRGNKFVTKEDMTEAGIYGAIGAASIAKWAAGYGMVKAMQRRNINEARFNSWGGRILPSSVEYETLWTDGDTSILEKIRK